MIIIRLLLSSFWGLSHLFSCVCPIHIPLTSRLKNFAQFFASLAREIFYMILKFHTSNSNSRFYISFIPNREQNRQTIQISQPISSLLQHQQHPREGALAGRRGHLQSLSNQECRRRSTSNRRLRHRAARPKAEEEKANSAACRHESRQCQRDGLDLAQRDVGSEAMATRAQAQSWPARAHHADRWLQLGVWRRSVSSAIASTHKT